MNCRICGLIQDEPPWGDDNNTPTFNICDCCGVEFGYEDTKYDAVVRYRAKWIAGGAKWAYPKYRPPEWSLEDQLKDIDPQWL